MSTPVKITDGSGTETQAKVTVAGQLVTGPFSYDQVSSVTLGVDDTAVNFYPPVAGQQFVITTILLTANKNVTTDCTVVIYEADSPTDTVPDKTILNVEMLKNTSRDITGLNLLITSGKFINGKTDDDDVFATIMGYYIPRLE